MDFLRDRGFAYAIGAVEFADNIRLNVLDRFLPYQSPFHIKNNADSLEGKVGYRTDPLSQYGLLLLRPDVNLPHRTHVLTDMHCLRLAASCSSA